VFQRELYYESIDYFTRELKPISLSAPTTDHAHYHKFF